MRGRSSLQISQTTRRNIKPSIVRYCCDLRSQSGFGKESCMGDYVFNGLSPEATQAISSFISSKYDELWMEVEDKTAKILSHFQPSRASEERRKVVIDYVEGLIEREFDCKVFPFGSVPLKTYLPDGDIDLTAISGFRLLNNTWATDVSAVLEREERNGNSEFHVKEVKCIYAKVPVVKCLVENLIVDISFNQLGGLSTLCFLEEVDRLIGRDHLFKRSIILVKAWCFYESRILGAHHGLLSTYALEVLVLYVFHVFNQSLRGPLEVLFRFLQYFSKFDWKQYCLSLCGPIPLASLHTVAVEPTQNPDNKFLLSEHYLSACREKYKTLQEGTQGKTFGQKFMNLMDPLRPSNNLGRSVNRGNFVRIHSAFAYGAAQLEKLLQSPKEIFSDALARFFRNTQGHFQAHCLDASTVCSPINPALCSCKTNSEASTSSMEKREETVHVIATQEEQVNRPGRIDRSSNYDGGGHEQKADTMKLRVNAANVSEDDSTDGSQDVHQNTVPMIFDDNITSKHDAPADFADIVETFTNQDIGFLFDQHFVNIILKDRIQLLENASSSPLNDMPTRLSEVGACKLEESNHQQNHEAGQYDAIQTDDLSCSHTIQSQNSEIRDSDADILEGDYGIHLCNLEAGRFYQNMHMHGNLPYVYSIYHQRGLMWEAHGRHPAMSLDHFSQNNSGRNGIPQDRYIMFNNMFPDEVPKNRRGIGTFFPILKPKLERDKYLSENGNRDSQGSIDGINSVTAANQNGSLAFRSKTHLTKKQYGLNKTRTKTSTGPIIGEVWESSADDSVLGGVSSIPIIFQKQIDLGDSNSGTNGRSLHLPLEKLEFGSFGPGFLTQGLYDVNTNKDAMSTSQSHVNRSLHGDTSESTTTIAISISQGQGHSLNHNKSGPGVSKAILKGHRNDQNKSDQCSYELREEDFPPLTFFGQRESSSMFEAQKSTKLAS